MKIYVITHKPIELILPEGYQRMLVGACKKRNTIQNEDYEFDDKSIDNISDKNANYCELTGLYWIWKNSNEKIKGLVHYRRFFTRNRFSSDAQLYYSTEKIESILDRYQAIVAERIYVDEPTLLDDYKKNHKEKDWVLMREIIADKFPQYMSAFEKMERSNWFFPYNMLITEKGIFNAFSEWLFEVLETLESHVDLSGYDVQQSRIYGFMSERLLGVWLDTNNIKYYEAAVIQVDSRFRYRIRRCLEIKLRRKVSLRK